MPDRGSEPAHAAGDLESSRQARSAGINRYIADVERPIRRRVTGLPAFAVTRGGEYFFLPGLNALRRLARPEG